MIKRIISCTALNSKCLGYQLLQPGLLDPPGRTSSNLCTAVVCAKHAYVSSALPFFCTLCLSLSRAGEQTKFLVDLSVPPLLRLRLYRRLYSSAMQGSKRKYLWTFCTTCSLKRA